MDKNLNKNNFTKHEIEILKKYYKLELLKAEEKVKEIKLSIRNLVDLLKEDSNKIPDDKRKKIIVSGSPFIREKRTGVKSVYKPKQLKLVHIGWTNLIIDTLRSRKTLLPSRAFLEIVENKYKLKEEEKKRVRSNITGCLSDLTKKYNRIVRYGEHGNKKGLYGLAEWFDSKGKLQPVYKQKLFKM